VIQDKIRKKKSFPTGNNFSRRINRSLTREKPSSTLSSPKKRPQSMEIHSSTVERKQLDSEFSLKSPKSRSPKPTKTKTPKKEKKDKALKNSGKKPIKKSSSSTSSSSSSH